MAVTDLAMPCGPSCSSSLVLLDVFPMIASGLRELTQEPYSGSPGLVRLSFALVAIPLIVRAGAHSSALQSWSVTPVNSKVSSSPRMQLPPLIR